MENNDLLFAYLVRQEAVKNVQAMHDGTPPDTELVRLINEEIDHIVKTTLRINARIQTIVAEG